MSYYKTLRTKKTSPGEFISPHGTSLQRKCACGNHAGGGECDTCKKNKSSLQRMAVNNSEVGESSPIVHETLDSPGQRLDKGIRDFMESRLDTVKSSGIQSGGQQHALEEEAETAANKAVLEPSASSPQGHDFSNIRIHTDANAAESAEKINAVAYTVGHDVFFGAGQYNPSSHEGKKLIAHELMHVLQQNQSSASFGSLQMKQKGSQPKTTKSKPAGKITLGFDPKLVKLYLWPNAWGSIGGVQSIPIGKEVIDQLIAAGAQINVLFVAERSDIPYSAYDTQGYTHELGGGFFDIYVLAGEEEYYMERTSYGSMTMKSRTRSRPQEDTAGTLFHELLHAWFMMYFPNALMHSGHKAGATPLGDPKFDPTGYEPEFLSRLQRFESEMQKLKAKLRPKSKQSP